MGSIVLILLLTAMLFTIDYIWDNLNINIVTALRIINLISAVRVYSAALFIVIFYEYASIEALLVILMFEIVISAVTRGRGVGFLYKGLDKNTTKHEKWMRVRLLSSLILIAFCTCSMFFLKGVNGKRIAVIIITCAVLAVWELLYIKKKVRIIIGICGLLAGFCFHVVIIMKVGPAYIPALIYFAISCFADVFTRRHIVRIGWEKEDWFRIAFDLGLMQFLIWIYI